LLIAYKGANITKKSKLTSYKAGIVSFTFDYA